MTSEVLERLRQSLSDRYRLERELGAGGMATVYLAHDLKHERDVAIKVLHQDLAAALGAERFLAEIKTTAKLQHPHILPLLDSGEAAGLLYYVMPYVAGESLRDRLHREKQLPIEDAVRIAREVADALGHAHGHGIIHRDIKPENILLQEGHALVADFGIALAVQSAGGQRMTQTGLSLGTPQYMSPEQAMGEKAIDLRADIYALGAVTYEMLTGEPPFTGATVQAIAAKVMSSEPEPLTRVRRTVPVHVEAAVLRALEKLPADRFGAAHELATALGDPGFRSRATGTVRPPGTAGRRPVSLRAALLAAGLLALGAVSAWLLKPAEPSASQGLARLVVPLPAGTQLAYLGPSVAVSRDGSLIAFVAAVRDGSEALYVRGIRDWEAKRLVGSASFPAFSPDGRWVVYASETGALMKIPVAGGVPTTLTDSGSYGGASWGTNGMIYAAAEDGIRKIPESGGTPEQVTRISYTRGENAHGSPRVVADGKALLFTVCTGWGWDECRIEAMSLVTGDRKVLVRGGTSGFYVQPGILVYHRAEREELLAIPVDLDRLEVVGEGVPLGEHVLSGAGGVPRFGISEAGTLVAVAGNPQGIQRQIGWRAPGDTALTPIPLAPRAFMDTRLAPDGRHAALQVLDASVSIGVYDLRSGAFDQLTSRSSSSFFPVWSGDSKRIAYTGIRSGLWGIYAMALDTPGSEVELLAGAEGRRPLPIAWTRGNQALLLQIMDATGSDLWTLELGTRKLERVLATTGWECCATLSPDGRWIAYTSSMSGVFELYLQAFPIQGKRWQLSRQGGMDPRWSPDGSRVYYFTGTKLMSVDLGSVAAPDPAPPRLVLEHGYRQTNEREWDVSSDGRRFLLQDRSASERSVVQLNVILNWGEELRRRVR